LASSSRAKHIVERAPEPVRDVRQVNERARIERLLDAPVELARIPSADPIDEARVVVS
jgi:hypothetical protein